MIWLPESASTMAPRVDALFWFIVAVSVVSTILIAVLLLFFAVRYRRQPGNEVPQEGHPPNAKLLEATWTIIPLILTMVMFFWGAHVYFDIVRPPDNTLDIHVIGKQWMWHTQHPGGQGEINHLTIPLGKPIKLIMTSEDVIHDFYVPAFRVKADVVPGKYTYLWFEATKTGTFHLFCAMYCGTEHARMVGSVTVLEPQDYEAWLASKPFRSMAVQGRQLFQKLQCVTCHHPEAGNRAPILENLFGRKVLIESGNGTREVLADESYIRESILYPGRKVRAGWQAIMPSYINQVKEDELIKVIAYIKSLKSGDTPPRMEEYPAPAIDPADTKK
jgi:cytochrome c oxidase subunit 2